MHYHWEDTNSVIKDMTITGNGLKSTLEARIYATDPNITNTEFSTLDKALIKRGFNVTYDHAGDQSFIRVTGIASKEQLLEFLEEDRYIIGPAKENSNTQYSQPEASSGKKNTLLIAAAFYMLGNVATIISGLLRRDKSELTTGLAFTVGDSSMLLFGKRSEKEKSQDIMQEFGGFMRLNGHVPSQGSLFSTSAIKDAPSNWGQIRNFMHDKVIGVKAISEVVAGTNFARAGIKQNNVYKTAAGSAIATGFGLGFAIPEKTHAELRDEFGGITDEEVSKKIKDLPFFKRILYSIQQKPLILSGSFAFLNNILTLVGSFDEAKNFWQRKEIASKLGGSEVNPNHVLSNNGQTGYYNILPWKKSFVPVNQTASQGLEEAKAALNSASSESERYEKRAELEKAQEKHDHLTYEYESLTSKNPYSKYVKPENFWVLNVLQASFFAVANFFYSITPKSGGKGSAEISERFFAAAASEIMLAETQESKEMIFNLASQYAGNKKELDFTKDEARQEIKKRLNALTENPWLTAKRETAHSVEAMQSKAANSNTLAREEETVQRNSTPANGERATDNEEPQHPSESRAQNFKYKLDEMIAARKQQAEENFSKRIRPSSEGHVLNADEKWKKYKPQSDRIPEEGHAAGIEL